MLLHLGLYYIWDRLLHLGLQHSYLYLDIFMTLFKYAKKVTLSDAKEDVDKVCIVVRKTSDNADSA